MIFESGWSRILVCYLMIGLATQLPGGLTRQYLVWRVVRRNYELHGPRALLDTPFVWIPFTIVLWPVPFIRAGFRPAPLAAAGFGFLAALALLYWSSTAWAAVLIVLVAGLVPVYALRSRP